jgi:tetratricopeptide (TPR) repeat protein
MQPYQGAGGALALYNSAWARELVARGAGELEELHDAAFYCDKGYEAQQQKRYAEAVHWYEKALSVDEEHERALFLMGYCYLSSNCKLGDEEELYGLGIKACSRRSRDLLQRLLRVRTRAGELEEADSATYNNLGCALGNLELRDEEEEAFREAVRLDPHDPMARTNLGATLWAKGDRRAAEEHFVLAQQENPDHPNTAYQYGLLLDRTGERTAALEQFRHYLEVVDREDRWERRKIDHAIRRCDQLNQRLQGRE